ncbi:MAG: hemerythrin domain-containing protein [Bdellovibrionia bacterium]
MNIYDALHKDHEKLHGLLDDLVHAAQSDHEKCKGLVDQIRDELVPHSRAEEAVFYNAIRELNMDKGIVVNSYAEHAKAEADLRTLQVMKEVDINSVALAKQLRKDVLHHIKDEENKVFTVAKKLFTFEEAKMIGKAFSQLKPTVKDQSFIGTSLDLIANLLPPRLMEGFRRTFMGKEKRSA